ncbi:MAG: hypothetical protein E7586_04530 [Ruminococcaceae bacterium]|nr:hypothetical protein [Oscillospiraceae bacterium]
MGENPKFSAIAGDDGFYITDLLGVCNDTLFVEAPIGEYLDEFEKNIGKSYDPEMPKKTIDGVKALLTVVKEAIIKNIPSENFVKETKTVSVNGVDFENASVFSITITKEMAVNLAKDVINGVFEIEFFTNLMSQADVDLEDAKNEALDSIDFEDFKSVKIEAILDSENKLAGFDIIAEAGNDILALRLASKDGGFTFKAGLLDDKGEFIADQGVVSIDYTFDEATKAEKMVANVNNADGGTVLTIEGTVDGNKREGSFTAVVSEADVEENSTLSFKYALESSDDTLVLNIKDIAVPGMTIPVDLTLSLSGDENNLKASLSVKLSMLPFAEVDAALEIAFELSEVEISVPSEFVNVNDITEADTTQWLADIQTKYSNITALIGQLADLFAPAEDYPMEDDFTVEYDDEALLYGDSLVA